MQRLSGQDISGEESGGGGGASIPRDSSSAKTRDTAGVFAGRRERRKLWLGHLGGLLLFASLSAE